MEIRRDPNQSGIVVIDGYAVDNRIFHVIAGNVTLAGLTILGDGRPVFVLDPNQVSA